ncbi:MAG: isoleucine--tRNA ligase [Planctomycetes bacterium]|nr:isoleucine--tRNA ligase [Planctomycetota bacterium]
MPFEPLPARYDFNAAEARTLRFWDERRIFEKSLEARKGRPAFVFYEGPPTANGKPHPGHVLGRVIKDIFPRYKTMKGHLVPRKAGWDTHGLPVEREVEKELGISGKEGIERYGVEAFTHRCLESVFRYTREWEELTERIGFWIDTSGAYATFHQSYVESVWWSLKQLFDRGLLYQDRKIVWWWAQGGTTLSAAEVGLGYREVSDPSVYVRFRAEEDPRLSYLAWTTTPWTLPSNVALAVKADGDYVGAELPVEGGGTETVVVAEALLKKVLPKGAVPVSVSPPFKGKALEGKRYRQLLPYARPEGGRSFEVVCADFVSIDASLEDGFGTGFVHIAPAFGEDDHRLMKSAGLGFLQLVDEKGRMTPEVTGFEGVFCKEADRGLVRHMRSQGLLFREEAYVHEYPFCYRAESDPLIQYARPGWFISTSRFREAMLANSSKVSWVPDNIRDGRFGNFLESNVDWALSRERYWGTPLPIWRCEATGHMEAIGSYAELLSKPDVRGTDAFDRVLERKPDLPGHLRVHKPYIDQVTYRSPKDPEARMRRVPEVIDCWYDSGAMPFAQWGYPHAPGSRERFEAAFPADFISEGIDQTRGWFYTLLAESTLVHEGKAYPHPFRTCLVTGHVCDEKGLKMSKQKKNYLDPKEVLDAHGADAMRWSFVSQVHPWTSLRFSMDRVGDAKKDFLIRLQNVWSFFVIYANIDGFDPAAAGAGGPSPRRGKGLLDRWIVSELHATARRVTSCLDGLDILGATRALFDLVDHLSNWYVRASRPRFWASGLGEDKLDAYATLYECLSVLSRLIAPFVPFFAEDLYRNLVAGPSGGKAAESVHLTEYPAADERLIDEALSRRMDLALEVVALGRAARAEAGLRVRQPLRKAVLVLADPAMEGALADLLPLVKDELNVKEFAFAENADQYVHYQLKPSFKRIGPRLGPLVQKLKGALAAADAAALRVSLESTGRCEVLVEGKAVALSREEIEVGLVPREGYTARAGGGVVLVLDTRLDQALIEEWWAREVVAATNGLRGDRELRYEARIRLDLWCGPKLRHALERNLEHLKTETLSTAVTFHELSEPGGALEGAAGDEPFRVDLTT